MSSLFDQVKKFTNLSVEQVGDFVRVSRSWHPHWLYVGQKADGTFGVSVNSSPNSTNLLEIGGGSKGNAAFLADELNKFSAVLEIKNLHVKLADEDRVIINGLNLTVKAGEVHAVMGPNGSGKSTLSYVLSGREGYEVTEGTVTYKGEDMLAMTPSDRASKGVFLAFQYPIEIPGVATMQFLKVALNSQRKARGEKEMTTPDFMRYVKERAAKLNIGQDMLKRPVNVGFSGGEKKRAEILQMAVLEPHLCILDETDSGLDIDALRVVADGVNSLRSPDRAMIVITHYQRLLDYIVPDKVHVLSKGQIVKSGDKSLALELEAKGYAEFAGAAA
jgi:Fe-S cluster assembly ATP-binding protein